jgi:hypothetical protein
MQRNTPNATRKRDQIAMGIWLGRLEWTMRRMMVGRGQEGRRD